VPRLSLPATWEALARYYARGVISDPARDAASGETVGIGACFTAGRALAGHMGRTDRVNYFDRLGKDATVCHALGHDVTVRIDVLSSRLHLAPISPNDPMGGPTSLNQWRINERSNGQLMVVLEFPVYDATVRRRVSTGILSSGCSRAEGAMKTTVALSFPQNGAPVDHPVLSQVHKRLGGQVTVVLNSLTSNNTSTGYAVQTDLMERQGNPLVVVRSAAAAGLLKAFQVGEGQLRNMEIRWIDAARSTNGLFGIMSPYGARRAITTAMAPCLR